MSHVPVGRRSFGIGGGNRVDELGGTSRHANQIGAKSYGSIDGGVVGALLRHGDKGYEPLRESAKAASSSGECVIVITDQAPWQRPFV
ncbi:MAG TPA: hypothetical protein VJS67_09165 [Pseudonocardiaceae bacterium]|nr:hypothetical protein [Pseudonocardiaceae bacterium]